MTPANVLGALAVALALATAAACGALVDGPRADGSAVGQDVTAPQDGGSGVGPEGSDEERADGALVDAQVDGEVGEDVTIPQGSGSDAMATGWDAPTLATDGPVGSTICPAAVPPSPICGAPACSNGKIDSCQQCVQGDGAPGLSCSSLTEACDGNNLNGATCQSKGYVGGNLSCGSWCDFDASGCLTCVPSSHVQSCGRASVDAIEPSSVVLVASDTEIALAWVSLGRAHFARFRPDLSLIMQSECIARDAYDVTLAATSTGYLLGIDMSIHIELHPLTADGQPRGSVRIVDGNAPDLVTRREPGKAVVGGPLLVRTVPADTGGRFAELLDDDGVSQTAPANIISNLALSYGSGVFTGDAFLYAESERTADLTNRLTILRIGMDGRVAVRTSAFPSYSDYPWLAWTGTEGRITYGSSGGNLGMVFWARLDRNGVPLGSSVMLASSSLWAPLVSVGDDSVVLLRNVARLSPTGAIVTPAYALVQDPLAQYIWAQHGLALGMRGPDVIVAWLRGGFPGGVDLARLTP